MREDVKISLAIFFSIPIMFLLFPLLQILWSTLFPHSAKLYPYASKLGSPVHVALPIASSIFFFLLFRFLEREGLFEPRSPVFLVLMIAVVFLSFYVGIGGFYFFRYADPRILELSFTYFVYVPYWTVLAGLLSAWIFYVLPLKPFKKEESPSSRQAPGGV